jgi:hypothetical protein
MPVRRSHTVKPIPQPASPFWYALLLAALAGVLVPLDARAPLFAPALVEFDLAGYGRALVQQVYLGIKAAMLWVPLGFLASLAGWDRVLRRWAPAAMVLLAVGLPALPEVRVGDALELLFALPGLALGLWLGQATRDDGGLRSTVSPQTETVSARAGHPTVPEHAAAPVAEEGVPSTQSLQTVANAAAVAHVGPLRLLAACAVLLAVAAGLWDFPRWPVLLGLGLTLYAALLWFRPLAWLVAVPAALPLLDLAPWTGRFFLDEFDLIMLVTAGMLFLRGTHGRPRSLLPGAGMLMVAFGISALASLLAGLLPIPALDANAFSSYWSPYNALRVAKGLLWGGMLFLWLRQAPLQPDSLAKRLAVGMGLGLLGVGLVGAWEHHLFVDAAGHATYRIAATFSSMHTGGGHIEAYLVAALPFLWLATSKFRHLAFTAPVMLLTAYVMLYTVARGGVLALGVVLVILTVASLRLTWQGRGWRSAVPVTALAAVGVVLVTGAGMGYLQQRLAQVEEDWQTRVEHWRLAWHMMDDTFTAQAFGMGLGSFPRVYQERGPLEQQAASFGFASEQGNTYLRLGSGQTLYYAQRVPFVAGQTYRLDLEVRSRTGATRLEIPLCEKWLLESRQCEWFGFDVPGDGAWHRLSHPFASTRVGAEGWWNRPPVELALYHPGKGGVVDVDKLRLLDPDGQDVLCNGDFSQGGDCWFFKTHSHLPWHIKNLWVHLLFEQGWLGLGVWAMLTILALTRLARAGWQGHRLAWALLASLAGLLTVGLFDSLLDTPRLATLLVATVLLGAGYPWTAPGRRPSLQGYAPPQRRAKRSGGRLSLPPMGP